jgi:alpha-glucoside transport system substrate-binding protein
VRTIPTTHRRPHRLLAGAGAAVLAGALLAGCGSSGTSSTGAPSGTPPTDTGGSGGSTQPSGGGSGPALPDLSGVKFTVLGQWTGAEQAAFQAVLDQFDSTTGAKGTYTAAPGGDEATVLGSKVSGGNPPDVAILALPGAIAQYAGSHNLQPVGSDGQAAVQANFSGEWAKLATVGGTLYGVPVDASDKSTVWYLAKAFSDAGITTPPATWEDMLQDAKTLSASGVTVPVSIGGGDGWTLTDWFENVYIRTAGLDMYDKLAKHQIPWTDKSVTTALTTLKQVFGDPSISGDPKKALQTSFTASVDNVFKASPTSAIVYEASFVATTIQGDKDPAKVGTDALFFPFPSVNGSQPVMEAGGDFASAFTDNKAAQAFLTYLASPQAAQTLVSAPDSGFLSANKNLDTSSYPDQTSAQLGQQIVSVGDNFRFDMSDQAPAAFGGTPNQGEWADLQSFLKTGDVQATQQALEKDANAAHGW